MPQNQKPSPNLFKSGQQHSSKVSKISCSGSQTGRRGFGSAEESTEGHPVPVLLKYRCKLGRDFHFHRFNLLTTWENEGPESWELSSPAWISHNWKAEAAVQHGVLEAHHPKFIENRELSLHQPATVYDTSYLTVSLCEQKEWWRMVWESSNWIPLSLIVQDWSSAVNLMRWLKPSATNRPRACS